jgi:hypothetical protein
MRIVAAICNIVLLVFTAFVLVTDGLPMEAPYIALTLLLVLVPVLSLVVILRAGASMGLGLPTGSEESEGGKKAGVVPPAWNAMRTVTIICNIVLFGFACWALADQYPHPEEGGFIPYALLVLATPILNVVALSRRGPAAS